MCVEAVTNRHSVRGFVYVWVVYLWYMGYICASGDRWSPLRLDVGKIYMRYMRVLKKDCSHAGDSWGSCVLDYFSSSSISSFWLVWSPNQKKKKKMSTPRVVNHPILASSLISLIPKHSVAIGMLEIVMIAITSEKIDMLFTVFCENILPIKTNSCIAETRITKKVVPGLFTKNSLMI